MIATAPTKYVPTNLNTRCATALSSNCAGAPDLAYFRQRYPATVMNFGALPRREEWLRRIWQADARWRALLATSSGRMSVEETYVRSAPPTHLAIEAEFEVIYANGALALLHGALLACRSERRVLVFGAQQDANGGPEEHGDWHFSEDELSELTRSGLFTKEEIARAVVNRYRSGFVKFHDAASRVKADPLWMSGVLDVCVDAELLLRLAADKFRAHASRGCALLENLRFVRAYVEPHRVTIETADARGVRRLFSARLFVDAGGAQSPLARQLDDGRSTLTHVWPAVGTLARGFVRGTERDTVDFQTSELLVSTEDARAHRQLLWQGLGANAARDEYATRLFFYDATNSAADKSLLSLFERYFEALPSYKRAGAQWRVQKPLFGYASGFQQRGWKTRRKFADARVLVIGVGGEATRQERTLNLAHFGSHARELCGLTQAVNLALETDSLDAASLAEIYASSAERRQGVAQAAGLAELLRPTPQGAPEAVNETLNALMSALHHLDERVRREFFQARLSFNSLGKLLAHTARLYPRILMRVRERCDERGALGWSARLLEAAVGEWRDERALAAKLRRVDEKSASD